MKKGTNNEVSFVEIIYLTGCHYRTKFKSLALKVTSLVLVSSVALRLHDNLKNGHLRAILAMLSFHLLKTALVSHFTLCHCYHRPIHICPRCRTFYSITLSNQALFWSFSIYLYSNKFVTKWYQNRQSLLNSIFIMDRETQHAFTCHNKRQLRQVKFKHHHYCLKHVNETSHKVRKRPTKNTDGKF